MDRRGLAKRFLNGEYLAELTSRMRSEEIPKTLDRLEAVFDPEIELKRKAAKGKESEGSAAEAIDVLLATNMISVGVDVKRLGADGRGGQPKATAEYIQATSRVGRSQARAGLHGFQLGPATGHVATTKPSSITTPRSTSTLKPLSVTPFSPGALQRGLAGLLVSLVRLRGMEFNPNDHCMHDSRPSNPYVQEAIETIARRAELIG